jgi:hypothetical protein
MDDYEVQISVTYRRDNNLTVWYPSGFHRYWVVLPLSCINIGHRGTRTKDILGYSVRRSSSLFLTVFSSSQVANGDRGT